MKLTFLVLVAVCWGAQGCAHNYLPAIWDSGLPITQPPGRPVSVGDPAFQLLWGDVRDPSKSALIRRFKRVNVTNAISAEFVKGAAYNPGESNNLGSITYSINRDFGWWNHTMLLSAYGGSYNIVHHSDSSLHGQNAFAGFAFLNDLNGYLELGPVDVGLGALVGATAEFGAYTRSYFMDDIGLRIPTFGEHYLVQYNFTEQTVAGIQAFRSISGRGATFFYFDEGTGYWICARTRDHRFAASIGISFLLD